VGGDAAFGAGTAGERAGTAGERAGTAGENADTDGQTGPDASSARAGPRGLPDILKAYLRAEQQLGRVDAAADIDAVATLIVGAIHGEILPRVLFSPPGSPVIIPPDLAPRLARTILGGIGP
jgi:hypothetical protein